VLIDYQNLVDNMVRAPAETMKAEDRDMAIELARLRYSSDAERKLTQDVVWAGAGYLGPLPAGWVDGSYLVSGEYPIGQQPLSLIEISIYVTTVDQQLVTTESLPAEATVRVQFAAPHVLQGEDVAAVDTIPLAHREAVANYAAHVLFKQLAAHFSGERETSIGADGSNTESRARNYAYRAKECRAAYYGGIGKVDPQGDKAGAAGVAGDPAASVSSWSGRGRSNLVDRSLLS
jgi:hypothetical protein